MTLQRHLAFCLAFSACAEAPTSKRDAKTKSEASQNENSDAKSSANTVSSESTDTGAEGKVTGAEGKVAKTAVDTPKVATACLGTIVLKETFFVDAKVKDYKNLASTNGTAPLQFAKTKLSKTSTLNITLPNPNESVTYTNATNVSSQLPKATCTEALVISEVSSQNAIVAQIKAQDLGKTYNVQQDDSLLYIGISELPNWYHDNSGGCTVSIEIREKKLCP